MGEPTETQREALLAWADAERKAREAWGEVDRPLGSLDRAHYLQEKANAAWKAVLVTFPRFVSPTPGGPS